MSGRDTPTVVAGRKMIAYPAIDLMAGRVVQLVGGHPEKRRIDLPGPVQVARRWIAAGFTRLHVVDLDAALGRGANQAEIAAIAAAVEVPLQIGGGIREAAAADRMVAIGASRVIVGTRAVEDPDWLARLTDRHPGRIVVAADFRNDRVVIEGWQKHTDVEISTLLTRLEGLPLAGVLMTDVGREGRLAGVATEGFAAAARASEHPIMAAGGIRSLGELRDLAEAGVAGAVLGMALYTGAVDAVSVAREFG